MNKENEIAAMYINCKLEGIAITQEDCKKLYCLINDQGYDPEEALKLINEQ